MASRGVNHTDHAIMGILVDLHDAHDAADVENHPARLFLSFNTTFAPKHGIQPLTQFQDLHKTLDSIQSFLKRLIRSSYWVRRAFRKYGKHSAELVELRQKRQAQHLACIEQMVEYWKKEEDRSKREIYTIISADATKKRDKILSQRLAELSVAEEVKREVTKQLYFRERAALKKREETYKIKVTSMQQRYNDLKQHVEDLYLGNKPDEDRPAKIELSKNETDPRKEFERVGQSLQALLDKPPALKFTPDTVPFTTLLDGWRELSPGIIRKMAEASYTFKSAQENVDQESSSDQPDSDVAASSVELFRPQTSESVGAGAMSSTDPATLSTELGPRRITSMRNLLQHCKSSGDLRTMGMLRGNPTLETSSNIPTSSPGLPAQSSAIPPRPLGRLASLRNARSEGNLLRQAGGMLLSPASSVASGAPSLSNSGMLPRQDSFKGLPPRQESFRGSPARQESFRLTTPSSPKNDSSINLNRLRDMVINSPARISASPTASALNPLPEDQKRFPPPLEAVSSDLESQVIANVLGMPSSPSRLRPLSPEAGTLTGTLARPAFQPTPLARNASSPKLSSLIQPASSPPTRPVSRNLPSLEVSGSPLQSKQKAKIGWDLPST